MKLKYTLSACVDCVAWAANGTIPEDRPNLLNDIHDCLGADANEVIANADGLNAHGEPYRDSEGNEIDSDHPDYELRREDWFSWSHCGCCGSSLGGMRNRLAILCK